MKIRMAHILLALFLGALVGATGQGLVDAPWTTGRDGGYQEQHAGFLPLTAAEVNQDWNVTWGGALDEKAYRCMLDNTGEYVYLAGCTFSVGEGNGDALLVKYAINGTQVWNRTWGGAQRDMFIGIRVDGNNDIIVCGATQSFPVGGTEDAILLKYDASGTLLWNETWGKAWNDCFTDIALDTSGNIYLATYYTVTGGNADMGLLKYDSNGHYLWNRTWGTGANDGIGGVAVDPNTNDVYLSGDSAGLDAKLIKYDSEGNHLWNCTWGGSGEELRGPCAVDSGGDVYMSGLCNSFGLYWDVFAAKYDSTGTPLWDRTWGGNLADTPASITVDSRNAIYISGYTESFGAGVRDAFVLSYDSAGNKRWNITWGGSNDELSCGICLDANLNIYLAGDTASYGRGGYDAFLAFIPDRPIINAPTRMLAYHGSSGNNITWTISDYITSNPTYSVYHNGTLWGKADQSWTAKVSFTTNVDDLELGDHNFTLVAQDGYGLSAQKMVLVTVTPGPFIIPPLFWIILGAGIASVMVAGTIVFWRRRKATKVPQRAPNGFPEGTRPIARDVPPNESPRSDSDIIPTQESTEETWFTYVSTTRAVKVWLFDGTLKHFALSLLVRRELWEEDRETGLDQALVLHLSETMTTLPVPGIPHFALIRGMSEQEHLLLVRVKDASILALLLNGRITRTYLSWVLDVYAAFETMQRTRNEISPDFFFDTLETHLKISRSFSHIESGAETNRILKMGNVPGLAEDPEIYQDARGLTPSECAWIVKKVKTLREILPSDAILDEVEHL